MDASTLPPGPPSTASTQAQPEEGAGLNKVMWYGILQLAGLAAGWAISFYLFGVMFTRTVGLNLPPNPTSAQVSAALGPLFQELSLIIPAVIVIALASLAVLTLGFRDLRKADRSKFSLPSALMIVMIVGVIIAAVGAVFLFNSIPAIISSAPANGGAPPSAFFGAISSLIFDFGLLAVGGILGLVGLIGGQILGLWRVGSRYDETLIKLGAIFAIIPLLNIVAPILVMIGAHQAKGRLAMPR